MSQYVSRQEKKTKRILKNYREVKKSQYNNKQYFNCDIIINKIFF